MGATEEFGFFQTSTSAGLGSIKFLFEPLTGDMSTSSVTITIAEIYNAETCLDPQTTTYSFILKVKEPIVTENNFDAPIIEVQEVEEEETTVVDSWVPPVYNPVVIEIESIDPLGLATIQFNQPLEVIFENLIVAFDQTSYEDPIDFNWTMAGNKTESYQI